MLENFKDFMLNEDGIGVIEVVLILVVLIGLVIIFKTNIQKVLKNVFDQINSKTGDGYN